jgi:alkylation response protein AidB-like acyl-CoA dehydrogenase
VSQAPARAYTFPAPDLSPAGLAQATREIAATAAHYDRTGEIPVSGLEAAHRAGLLTATVGTQYGGPGLNDGAVTRILKAIGEGDASVALLVANTLHGHTAQAQRGHWPAAYYADLLRRYQEGPALTNSIRAEPELGAPARGGLPKTTATRTSDGWSLSGRKAFATGGSALDYHVVWVTAVEDEHREQPRIGHLIVPAHLPGITWVDTWDHIGLRASNTHDVIYDDVRVPAEAFAEIPRGPGGVYRDPAAMTMSAALGNMALYVGVARAARSAFVEFARGRVPSALGRPIAETEHIQAVAGEIDLLISQAETLLHGTLLRVESGDKSMVPELSNIKVAIQRSVIAATHTAVAALGNPGLTRHHPLERHLRDALCVRVHPPQEDAVLRASGRRILGV